MLKMDLEYNKGVLFVRLKGNLNRKFTYKINSYLTPVLLKHKIKYLVYNFYNLESIDEFGLDAILNTKCAIKSNNGKICVCEAKKSVKEKIRRLKITTTTNELTALDLIEV